MVIDDDEPTNFLNRMIIEESDCATSVKTLQSAEKALEYLCDPKAGAEAHPLPELIFLDINMPAMDGWEFLEEYRKLNGQRKADVMVIMLTTSLLPEDRQKAEGIPEISCFENKPLTPDKLDRVIKHFFASK